MQGELLPYCDSAVQGFQARLLYTAAAPPLRPTFTADQELSPASQTARFEDLQVYRVGGGPRAPSSALPIGECMVHV